MSTIITLRPAAAVRNRLIMQPGASITKSVFVAVPDSTGGADLVMTQVFRHIADAQQCAAAMCFEQARVVRVVNAVEVDDVFLAEDAGPDSLLDIVDSCDFGRAPQLAMELTCIGCGGCTDDADALECATCAPEALAA